MCYFQILLGKVTKTSDVKSKTTQRLVPDQEKVNIAPFRNVFGYIEILKNCTFPKYIASDAMQKMIKKLKGFKCSFI